MRVGCVFDEIDDALLCYIRKNQHNESAQMNSL